MLLPVTETYQNPAKYLRWSVLKKQLKDFNLTILDVRQGSEYFSEQLTAVK